MKIEQSNRQKITPFLWFDTQAEEAMHFYMSIFKNSKVNAISRYGEAGPGPAGSVLTCVFTLEGLQIMALNAGPMFKLTEAFSLLINCESQEEVDYYWNNLTKGGEESQCGWLKDKFGLSWQVIPTLLGEMLQDKDAAKAGKVMQAMLKMRKIDIAKLKEAYGV